MDWNFILTILGVIATIAFGIWAVYLAFATTKKVQITYSCEKCVSLLHEFSKGIPDLKILYKENTVNEKLLLLRAYFINTGNKDITPEMVENKIRLCVPKEFSVIEVKITESTPMLKSSATIINSQAIEFDAGLWKAKEYFKFDALISGSNAIQNEDSAVNNNVNVPIHRTLNRQLYFQHRIADSQKINRATFPSDNSLAEANTKKLVPVSLLRRMTLILAIVTILFGAGAYFLPKFGFDKELNFKVKIANKETFATAWAKGNSIVVQGDSLPKQKISPTDFAHAYIGEVKIANSERSPFKLIGITYVIMGTILLVLQLFKSVRQNRILKFIKNCSDSISK